MKRIAGLVVMGMLLALCVVPNVEARLGVFVGPFSPNLEEMNKALDEAVNEKYGTSLRFDEEGLMYSLVPEGRISLNWSKRIDTSFYQTGTSGSYSYTTVSDAPDRLPVTIEHEVDLEVGIIAAPVFYTRIYWVSSRGRFSPYLGVGLGTVFTDLTVSQKTTLYFYHPDGYLQGTKKESWRQHFISVPLAGQILAGIQYIGRTKDIFLEARYIGSNKAEIQDRDAGIDTGVDWRGFGYRLGLMVGF